MAVLPFLLKSSAKDGLSQQQAFVYFLPVSDINATVGNCCSKPCVMGASALNLFLSHLTYYIGVCFRWNYFLIILL